MATKLFDSDARGKNDVLFKEQRTSKRYLSEISVDLSVSGDSSHTFYTGFTEDISAGGLFLETHQIYPVGSVMKINLSILGKKIALKAVVRWIKSPDTFDGGNDIHPGMGLQFVDLSQENKSIIETFIQQREPMFVDID